MVTREAGCNPGKQSQEVRIMDEWKDRVYHKAQEAASTLCGNAYKEAWEKQHKKRKKILWSVPDDAETLIQLCKDINAGRIDEEGAKATLLRVRLVNKI
jgi:hypothetical protein